jgi:hypothetical protein
MNLCLKPLSLELVLFESFPQEAVSSGHLCTHFEAQSFLDGLVMFRCFWLSQVSWLGHFSLCVCCLHVGSSLCHSQSQWGSSDATPGPLTTPCLVSVRLLALWPRSLGRGGSIGEVERADIGDLPIEQMPRIMQFPSKFQWRSWKRLKNLPLNLYGNTRGHE